MVARRLLTPLLVTVASLLGLGLGLGCGWIVGDGNYKVGTTSAALTDCDKCISTSCATQWAACANDPECAAYRACEDACGTQSFNASMSACNCNQLHPSATAAWTAVYYCGQQCSMCNFVGTGDPCQQDSDCSASAGTCCDPTATTCKSWCSPTCSSSATCGGDALGGTNVYGQKNFCIQNTLNANICFPGCQSNADCVGFPGTDCESATTVDVTPQSVMICTVPGSSDAGSD